MSSELSEVREIPDRCRAARRARPGVVTGDRPAWPPRLALLAAGAISLAGGARLQAQSPVRPCTVEGESARCGTITVPEDHRDPRGRTLELRVVVLGSSLAGERREPIFVLAGGPGQAATELQGWAAGIFADIRRTRDVVLLDQRGSGGSNHLSCAVAPRTFFVPADPQECRTRLTRQAALSLYGTESFVEDLELARRTLGYGRLVLFGASYGTRAAYAYARRYPRHVRAAVLMAPAPISMPILDAFAEEGRRSLDAIVSDCLADRRCSGAYPRLAGDVATFRARLTDPFLLFGLQFIQYSASTAAGIPRVLADAAAGNLAPLDSATVSLRSQLGAQIALGLHLSIICGEDLPFGAVAVASSARGEYARACRGWPAAAASPGFHDLVRVPVPALALVGEWDPITSPRWARVAAEAFSPGLVVSFPKTGHILEGWETCIGKLIASFLERQAIDASCARESHRPPYILRHSD